MLSGRLQKDGRRNLLSSLLLKYLHLKFYPFLFQQYMAVIMLPNYLMALKEVLKEDIPFHQEALVVFSWISSPCERSGVSTLTG